MPAEEIVHLGGLIDDLIHGDRDEIHELQFHHAAHAVDRRADSEADGGGLAERAIAHPFGTEFVEESAIDPNVPPYAPMS